ncbi:MAG: glutamate-1-semialdehyde 2,1-aminomutase [Candidatus Obscuribacterales bacterium]|nr:glutamate-1-semialdehyde 2,1-aminomutase [Candidatus Obscuribacterales bacterium]
MSPAQASFKTFYAEKSAAFAAEIEKLIPGGVDSPFRSFKEVGGHTIFFSKAQGAHLFDLDGNKYIDFLGAWGPAILGHCVPEITEACKQALELGPVFGSPHQFEFEMAKHLQEAMPGLEMMRFVNSGTEAVMSAVRLARGYSGKDMLVMFEGCYHGHSDSVLASQTHCSSAGIPEISKGNTVLVPYNDQDGMKECFRKHKGKIAAVLIEPVAGSMGVIPPDPGYLKAVEELCREENVLLIFDEVLTGLRVARGGAQALYDIKPDLSCLGKALGGGMAIGAYGGRAEIMQALEPIGKVYQAGTFSGNPLTMAGGIATLKLLRNPSMYEKLEASGKQLFDGLAEEIKKKNLPVQLQRVGSMFGIIFCKHPVRNFRDSLDIDAHSFARFYHELLKRGIYLPPSSVDAAAISAAHSSEDIEQAISGICDALGFVFSA